MSKTKDESIRIAASGIETLRKVNADKPGSLLMKTLFDAKSEELVNLFSGAPGDVKSQSAQTLSDLDPSNTTKYQKITSGGN